MTTPIHSGNDDARPFGRGPEFVPIPSSTYATEVGEIFRVGDIKNTLDLSLGEDGRLFAWQREPNDFEAAKYMGWYDFMQKPYTGHHPQVTEKIRGMSSMMIPGDMRSAASVLGGKKAWDTEKVEVFETVATRLGEYWNATKKYPTEFNWDAVGVTTKDDREIVILPPHKLEIVEDLSRVISTNEQIVAGFRDLLSDPSNLHEASLEKFQEKFMGTTEA